MYKNKKVFAIIDATENKKYRDSKKILSKQSAKKAEEILKKIDKLEYTDEYFNRPIFINTLLVFEESDIIDVVYLIIDEEDEETIKKLVEQYNIEKVEKYILSDSLRQYSMELALDEIIISKEEPQFIITHDAKAPFINEETIKQLGDGMHKNMACVFGYPLKDNVKKVNLDEMKIMEKVKVQELWNTQFPKMFLSGILISAYNYADEFKLYSEDDATLIEYMRFPIKILDGGMKNNLLDVSIFDTLGRIFEEKLK